MLSTGGLTAAVVSALSEHSPWSRDRATFQAGFNELLDAGRGYYGDRFNFEHLLDLLEAAIALVVGRVEGNAPTTAEVCLTEAAPRLASALDYSFLHEAQHVLVRTLLSATTAGSKDARAHEGWASFNRFWSFIGSYFDLTIATLNYDNLVEQALGLTGAHQGFAEVADERVWRLDPRALHEPRAAHELLHLHGSIHFGRREYGADLNRFCYEDGFHELYWHSDPEAAQRTIWGASAPRSQAGRDLAGGPIVTGLHKTDKLLAEPLASYFVEFSNRIVECPRLLVVGYGFLDAHVNAILARFGRVHGKGGRVVLMDRINMVQETGSAARSEMLVMTQRWAREHFEFRHDLPDPWISRDGALHFHWDGFPGVPAVWEGMVEVLRPEEVA